MAPTHVKLSSHISGWGMQIRGVANCPEIDFMKVGNYAVPSTPSGQSPLSPVLALFEVLFVALVLVAKIDHVLLIHSVYTLFSFLPCATKALNAVVVSTSCCSRLNFMLYSRLNIML